jgi:hypothetical protein
MWAEWAGVLDLAISVMKLLFSTERPCCFLMTFLSSAAIPNDFIRQLRISTIVILHSIMGHSFISS